MHGATILVGNEYVSALRQRSHFVSQLSNVEPNGAKSTELDLRYHFDLSRLDQDGGDADLSPSGQVAPT